MKPTAAVVASVRAFMKASSVRISSRSGGTSVNLEITKRGSEGSLSTDGIQAKLISVGGYIYLQPSAAYWRHYVGAAAAKTYAGDWMRASATKGALAKFMSSLNKTYLDKHLEAAIHESAGSLVKGTQTIIDGRAAVSVTDKAHDATFYIAATGTPFLLKAAGNGAPTLYLSGYDRPVSLRPPVHWINGTFG